MIHKFTFITKEKTSVKAKFIFSLSLLIPFTLVFIYVCTTATDLAFRDDMYLIKGGFVESYLNDTLTFDDLWRPSAGVRILGYNLMQIVIIKWFSMNSRLIVLLIPFLMLASAILIYREYRKSLALDCTSEFIAATFLALTFIIFNVIQREVLLFAYGFAFQSSMPFLIASFVSLELFISKGTRQYWPLAFILPALAVLVFGGTHCFAFAPALGSTFLCYLLTRRSRLTKDFWFRALIISVFLSVIAFLYMFRINHNDYVLAPNSSYYSTEIFARPVEAVRFLLAAFGASVVGVDAFFACTYFSFHTMVVLGLIVVLLYSLALVLFFRSQMHERTYLPFFLIMQTLWHLGLMTIGRFSFGIDYGMASRYTCVSIYGLVALVWIFIFILARPVRSNILLKSTLYAGLVTIFAGLLLTSIVVGWTAPPKLDKIC